VEWIKSCGVLQIGLSQVIVSRAAAEASSGNEDDDNDLMKRTWRWMMHAHPRHLLTSHLCAAHRLVRD